MLSNFGGLVVPPGDPLRGVFLQWLHYLASTLQPEVLIQFHPEFHHRDPALQAELKAASMARLGVIHATLDRALAQGPFFCGATPAVPDFILALQTVWDEIFPQRDISAYPHLARHRAEVCARPAVQRILALHAARKRRRDAAGVA